MGLASAVAPSAVKQGGGVTNQLSSMQPLSEPALLLLLLPLPSRPEPGDEDADADADSGDTLAPRLDRGGPAVEDLGCVLRRLRGGRGSARGVVCMLSRGLGSAWAWSGRDGASVSPSSGRTAQSASTESMTTNDRFRGWFGQSGNSILRGEGGMYLHKLMHQV